jgi:hypothetical protein
LRSSQALAVESANDLKRAKGWKSFTMSAYRVIPNPFWKTVRPVVPENVILKPDVVTAVTYTTCFTGVVVCIMQILAESRGDNDRVSRFVA